MCNKPKLAVIGASIGQMPLVRKANEMGIHTICFAWDNGAVCKDICSEFYPISIFETDKIVETCRSINVDGVATTASEETALVASVVTEELGLVGNPSSVIRNIQQKNIVRKLTSKVEGLDKPQVWTLRQLDRITYPCVVKPASGSAKKGVSFCDNPEKLTQAIEYAKAANDEVLIEEYIPGEEFSVESLSFNGKHHVIQITRKITTGYPHFVELEHHQPADLSEHMRKKIADLVGRLLTSVGFLHGASHTELKVHDDRVFLIEINPRGGGDHISDTLVGLSTDCDYVKEIVNIALGKYEFVQPHNISHSGIIYLSTQNPRILKYFNGQDFDWMVGREITSEVLTEATSNYNRNGFIIYNSQKPLHL